MLRRPARPEQTAEMRRLIVELIDQARRSGAVAEHITVGDVYALIWALRGLVETTASVAPRAWERHLELHLAGLRATPAPTRKRGLTMAQLDAISARRASAVEPDPS